MARTTTKYRKGEQVVFRFHDRAQVGGDGRTATLTRPLFKGRTSALLRDWWVTLDTGEVKLWNEADFASLAAPSVPRDAE